MVDLLSDRIIQAPTYHDHYLGEHGHLEKLDGRDSQKEKIDFDGREKRRGLREDTAFKCAIDTMDHFDRKAELLMFCAVCDKAIKTKAVNADRAIKKKKKKRSSLAV